MTLATRDGDKLRVLLHAGQRRAMESTARFLAVIAGFQGGKTCFGPWWLYNEIQRTRVAGEDNDYLAASATYDLLKLKMLPELVRVFCVELAIGEYLAGDGVIRLKADHQTRIIMRSGNVPQALESATARAAWCDEWGQDTVPIESWDALQRRLAVHQGRCLITTTPYNLGWLKSQLYDRWKGGDPNYEVVQFRSCDNPAFPDHEYQRLKDTLPAWKFAMFCNGEFTRPAGLIYGDYIDSYREHGGHMVKAFSIPQTWLRYVGVDFGAVNTALVWLAEDPATHDLYAYRERHGGVLTGPEHAREALEYKEPVRLWLGGAASEDQQRMDWQLAGCPVIEPFISDVEGGIDRVIGLFRQRRLFLFDTLTGLRSELGTYSRELDAAGEPTEKIAKKAAFHRLDSLRYVGSAFTLDRPVNPEPEEIYDPRSPLGIRQRDAMAEVQESPDY